MKKECLVLILILMPFYMIYAQQLNVEGDIDVNDGNIKNLADPLDASDAVNKAYVDKLLAEIDWLKSLLGVGEVTDDDGNVYPTVQIGTQFWMARNLNVGTMIEAPGNQTDNSIIEKYCYDNLESNCDKYGGLYQWDEIMQYATTEGVQGICPTGWHVPTELEWTTLIDYLGGLSEAGGKMKESGLANWDIPNTAATNESGFTALPGGFYNSNTSSFLSIHLGSYFWNSTEISGAVANAYLIFNSGSDLLKISFGKMARNSVRCIKDE